MPFNPSPRQTAIASELFGPRNILVQACAGSGKTTTMVWLAHQVPASVRVLALSFNKSIADELGRRMPAHVRSATAHSVGFGMIRKTLGSRVRLDDKKLRNLIDNHPGIVCQQGAAREAITADLLAVVPLVQDTMVDACNISILSAVAEVAGRNLDCPALSLPLVDSIISASDKMRNYITFGEMIRHPVIHDYAPDFHDIVMLDEAQDLNSAQHALLRKLVRPGGKIIAVGDRFQSIYGFRGADPRSMDRLAADWNMVELPLDVSYRCGTAIIDAAQKIVGVDTIKAREGAEAGEITTAKLEDLPDMAQEGDMILCRMNAPLVPVALKILKAGKKAQIRGRDIGAQLASLVRRARASDVRELLTYIADWKADRVGKLVAAKKSETAIQAVEDQAETLAAIAEECTTVADVLGRLSALFDDEREGVCLSTVHKAKGLESDTVFILGPELLPAPWAKSPSEMEQERNIHYVATTRAMRRLINVPLPDRRHRK